jgi:hypothetical protein
MKIFISGSMGINKLDDIVIKKLHSIINNKYIVLIGDAYGADVTVQKYFFDNQYSDLIVYYTGEKIRNNFGNWKTKQVTNSDNLKGRDFYTLKDIEMAKDADFGFMIWDGTSKGTKSNIKNMLERNKKFYVYVNKNLYDTRSFDYQKYSIRLESKYFEMEQLSLL